MLCLGRTVNQSIKIGPDIKITVIRIGSSGIVRLGIDAPREMNIVRDEIDRNDEPLPQPVPPTAERAM